MQRKYTLQAALENPGKTIERHSYAIHREL